MNLTNCDIEPIRIPGSIQPHGVLIALASHDLTVVQISENAGTHLGKDASACIGLSAEAVVGDAAAALLRTHQHLLPRGARPLLLGAVTLASGENAHALAHLTDDLVVLELEIGEDVAVADPHVTVDSFSLRAEDTPTIATLAKLVSEEIRKLTQFDRVLVYHFDENWNGSVVGEDGNGELPQLFDHWFPASDIPAQARELYRTNRIRIIPDAQYTPVPLVPPVRTESGAPLDMSFSALRSVSPVHVEYMRNMETESSMSVSILRGGVLWGLISCHHHEAKRVPFHVRATCDLLARAFSLRLSGLEPTHDYERRIELRESYTRLLAAMADRLDFIAPLAENHDDLLAFANATGAALVADERCILIGKTPSESNVRLIASWLFGNVDDEVFASNDLASVFPPAADMLDTAAGVMAVQVSKRSPSYVLWFRPEVAQTIKWSGEPKKGERRTSTGELVISPRKSFETWRQTVHGKSTSWKPSEISAATEFRHAVVGTVLRRADELATLNAELLRSNQELEAFSYSVSHDLRAPLRHIAGYAELLREGASHSLSERERRFISTILESTEFAGSLVDRLLEFSRMGRSQLYRTRVDFSALVNEIRRELDEEAKGRTIVWNIGTMPVVFGDLVMLRLLVRNLMENAVKYTKTREEAVIEISCRDAGKEWVFSVGDNGVGFDMQYSDKIFGVFQRLHRIEDFPGTGIGLANVRRVVERHGGRIWVEARENEGAKFHFTLPKPTDQEEQISSDAEADSAR